MELDERQLAVLRYLRAHAVATAATIAHEVLRAPRSTFGRPMKAAAAEDLLSTLATAGLVLQTEQDRHPHFMLTPAGRQALRESALGRKT